jgi:signal transduction histidine kinase/HAMP domain-containing protein
MSRADWLSASARRLGGLRQLEGNVARAVSATVSHDTMTAQANGIRDLVPALAVLGVVTALGLVVRQSITRPLQEVSDGARRLSSGDLRFGVGYEGDDEIGDVAAALGDLRGTTERLAGEIRSMNTAISESRLDHRADVGAFQGTWSRLLAGMNDTMAAFGGLHSREGALRRVATLVARGVPPEEIFAAVVVEVREHMAADAARLLRYEADGTATLVAASDPGMEIPLGSSMPLDRESSSARLPTNGIGSSVEAPIIVEGRVWGMISAAWTQPPPDSLDAEGRIAQFTELVATAIANAHSTAQLSASRARVVAAADETRRRIERDLHDGVQQRLVSLGLELRNAEATLPGGLAEAHARIQQIVRGLTAALDELRAMSRGIHPAVLSVGGLGTALRTLARRSPVPVELDLEGAVHLPQRVEVAAYYVVSEALTNVAKHAQASVAHVELRADEATVELAIRDDGVGGADPQRGSGLIGLADRVEAIGGRIRVTSRRGAGTSVLVALPLAEDRPVLPAGAFPRWLEAE